MGLDLTIYMAKNNPGNFHNPFAPDPPEGMHWHQVAEWRNNHVLAEALIPNAGSPDWKTLTLEDIERGLEAVATAARAENKPGNTTDPLMRALRTSAGVLRIVEGYIHEGRTLLVEVIR